MATKFGKLGIYLGYVAHYATFAKWKHVIILDAVIPFRWNTYTQGSMQGFGVGFQVASIAVQLPDEHSADRAIHCCS
jgi:hypothetical protein